MSSRRQASTESRLVSKQTSENSIILCKSLGRGDLIQVRPFHTGQLVVVRVVVNENGTVIVYTKTADPKAQRAFAELTNGYFEAAKHAVTLLRKALAVAPTQPEAPATSDALPLVNVTVGAQDFDAGAAVEGVADGDEANGEQDSGGLVKLAMFTSCIDSVRGANANLEPLIELHWVAKTAA